jgi:hypothetical protein
VRDIGVLVFGINILQSQINRIGCGQHLTRTIVLHFFCLPSI